MITNYLSYKIKIKDLEFVTEDGRKFPNTAAISFYDINKKETDYIEKAFVEQETVFQLIDNGEDININECYIENFSLKNYRKSRNIEKDEIVKIKNFSAIDCFFDSHGETDFSFAVFQGDFANFSKAHFINGGINFDSVNFEKADADFSYVYFNNGNVDFANVIFSGGDITFKNTLFGEGEKNFQYTDFGKGKLSFINTDFGNGDVLFLNSDFSDGEVSFKVARFGDGKVDFHFSKFGKGDISFEQTDFGTGKKDFRKIEFGSGKVNFNRAVFGDGDISFEACQLSKGKITFKKTILGNGLKSFELLEFHDAEILIERVDFGVGNVSFNKSHLKTLSLKSCHLDNYIDLRVAKCDYVDLSDTIVRDILDIQPYDFDVKITNLNIVGMRLLGRIDIDWYKNKVDKIIGLQTDTTHFEKAEQFRILKENYGNIGLYNFEDLAYVQFKRFEQKSDFHVALSKNKLHGIWQFPAYGFKWLMFDKVGLYATSPSRVFLSTMVTYLFFSLIHTILPYMMDTAINCIDPATGFMSRFLNTMYYSAITFFTIGYGDCSPVGFLRVIASLQGFIGVFMMSYFTVAFARKILR
ncbi:MAG TPA: hypothetical protein DDX39_00360 [Bacteroidales bacterium]|nr:MAG: hypothetical protein A2W98_03195 [Bacteroidetes bacterium GWF2_33_38]OFY73356.1 MAG: hypothetical protein A2265_02410 [Bacteroidetes bacterium RIFOXYA12_FULL_33_9]HBF87062.1 hypothetical protein [Bacteroidales bacterium]